MARSLTRRMLSPIVQVRAEESTTAFLMFAYSFLIMTSYNIVKPITRSKFISDLGADNLPYVLLGAGVLIGLVMTGYTWILGRLPRRWSLPIVQVAIVALLVGFWFLFQTDQEWVSVAFFFAGLILGILLISQFWTMANLVYDPRRRSGCSASSAAALRWGASPARPSSRTTWKRSARTTSCSSARPS